MHITKFEVTVKTAPRQLLIRECVVIEEAIKDAIDEQAKLGGMNPGDIGITVEGPHSYAPHMVQGTRVRIHSWGTVVEGSVLNATNYGNPTEGDDWYIEMRTTKGEYHYWKQRIDTGTMEVLNEAED